MSGLISYRAGLAAEDSVARHYSNTGGVMLASRWRGASGEIDLIMRDGAGIVFVEVKKAATHAEAALRVTRRQMARIYAAAAEFLAGEPAGQATESRFDVALMDSYGRIEVLENAFSG
jgi:putative endonuclease